MVKEIPEQLHATIITNSPVICVDYSIGSLSNLDYLIIEGCVPAQSLSQYEKWDIDIIQA